MNPANLLIKEEDRNQQYWYDRVQRLKPSPEEFMKRAMIIREEKENRFAEALQYYIDDQVGIRYRLEHEEKFLPCWGDMHSHIKELYETGIGAYYCGDPGSGKTNALLEFILQLCWREWEDLANMQNYPVASQLIDKTVHYVYVTQLCEQLKLGVKIPIAQYNLIDDFGVEASSPLVQSRLDEYIEEINRRGKCLVVSSNIHPSDLSKSVIHRRLYSRFLSLVHFYELPSVDYRNPKNRGVQP